MMIVNLTSHAVTLLDEDGSLKRTWPISSRPVPRLIETTELVTEDRGVKIYRKRYEGCQNLPDEEDGTCFIVSALVAREVRRPDLLTPNVVRGGAGRIVGCTGFSFVDEGGSGK